MSHFKPIHFLLLVLIGLVIFGIFLGQGNLLIGLLAGTISLILTFLAWTHPIPRTFIQQHNRLLRVISAGFLVVTSAGLLLPASQPLRQNIITLYLIAGVTLAIVYFKPSEMKG
jgi:hypothetical protein